MIKKFTLGDIAHLKPTQAPSKPAKKPRKKPVKVGSLSPEQKNAIRYILAERLKMHKEWAMTHGREIHMSSHTLAMWFVNERGQDFPGYTEQVLCAILRDANETGSPILRTGHGKYTVNEEVFNKFNLPVVA